MRFKPADVPFPIGENDGTFRLAVFLVRNRSSTNRLFRRNDVKIENERREIDRKRRFVILRAVEVIEFYSLVLLFSFLYFRLEFNIWGTELSETSRTARNFSFQRKTNGTMFISIDGGDGVGKSTQIVFLQKYWETKGRKVVLCREPGSTRLGEAVRNLLLNRRDLAISSKSEAFLFMAARAQMIREIVRPALQRGEIVLCDRFLLSTLVYQGFAGGESIDDLWSIGKIAIDSIFPDLTILLDVDPEIAFRRIQRPLDRMEAKGIAFHRSVREGFLQAAKKWNLEFPGRCFVLDASVSPSSVADEIRRLVEKGESLPQSREELEK